LENLGKLFTNSFSSFILIRKRFQSKEKGPKGASEGMEYSEMRLSVQTTLPEDYASNGEFQRELENLQKEGFYGVELNIARPEEVALEKILDHLERYGLKFTHFASGLTAKTYGLNLSSSDEALRRRSVEKGRDIVRYLGGSSIGIILGFFKGPRSDDPTQAKRQFRSSLEDLLPLAEQEKIPLVVEATNRYESSVANTLGEAAEFVRSLDSEMLKILPDTFHMNIEERNMREALTDFAGLYDNVHLSDNNRFFPGYGAIDFASVLDHLASLGYSGGFALEGNIKESFTRDCSVSMKLIKNYLQGRKG
jgi:sugar phosphate isomerase/epimerase